MSCSLFWSFYEKVPHRWASLQPCRNVFNCTVDTRCLVAISYLAPHPPRCMYTTWWEIDFAHLSHNSEKKARVKSASHADLMYLECRLRCQMVSAHGVWVKHQSAVLTQHTYWVTTTISRRTKTVINYMLDINYCIAVLNKTVSQLIVKFHVQLVNHIVWLFYGRKFPFTLNIVDLPSSLLSIKTTNWLLGSRRHFRVSKWTSIAGLGGCESSCHSQMDLWSS